MADLIYSRDVYGKTLAALGRRHRDIVVFDADLSGSTRTSFFAREFPERFFNFGVAEQNMFAAAAGMASCGKVVFVSTFAMFATTRALDQVRNSICFDNFNVKIVATHAGITVGEDGASHQALEDVAFFRALPNMKIIVPACPNETAEVIEEIYSVPGPVYVRLGRSKTEILDRKYKFSLGKGFILRPGKDVAVVACGIMVKPALDAAEELAKKGINVYVVNMPTINPLDKDLLVSLSRKVKGFVTCEEHSIIGGLGSAVAEAVSEASPCLVKRVGVRCQFGQSGSPAELLEKYKLNSHAIVDSVHQILDEKNSP